MIEHVTTPLHRQQYLRAAQGCPGLAARLACQLELFGEKPGSGWRFFTGDRGQCSALMLRGAAALGCGPWDSQELGLLLKFSGVQELTTPSPEAPEGYRLAEEYPLFTLPEQRPEALLTLPPEAEPDPEPPAMAVAKLVWEEEDDPTGEVWENLYSELCTARNHGMARVVGVRMDGRLISTVGAYGLWQGYAYLAAAETNPACRGRGVGGALLQKLAWSLKDEGFAPWFWCRQHLIPHYERLGFIQNGKLYKYIQIEE